MQDNTDTLRQPDNTRAKVHGKSRWSALRIIIIVGTCVVVVGVAMTTILGYLAISFKQPNERVVVQPHVCDDGIITRYNSAATSDGTPDAASDLISEFSKKANYQSDPTCLYIQFDVLIQKANYVSAKDAYDRLAALADRGEFVSTKLYNMAGLDSMQRRLMSIAPAGTGSGTDLTGVGND